MSWYTAAVATHQDAMDRLDELADRLEEEQGLVTDDKLRAALDRIAGIDGRRSRPGTSA